MPEFLRICWVSERAQNVWKGRMQRAVTAWRAVEVLSVTEGLRRCALLPVTSDICKDRLILAALTKSAVAQLSDAGVQREPAIPDALRHGERALLFLASDRDTLDLLLHAWSQQNHGQLGELLGYPQCCRDAFLRLSLRDRWIDSTWAICLTTSEERHSLGALIAKSTCYTNMLWRRAGLRAIPHTPCSTSCSASEDLGSVMTELGISNGLRGPMEDLKEILSWPASWSAVHGIAEVKTPILKLSMNTDPTDTPISIDWHGSRYPDEGATGLSFPYTHPESLLVTDSRAFRRGVTTLSPLVQVTNSCER